MAGNNASWMRKFAEKRRKEASQKDPSKRMKTIGESFNPDPAPLI